MSATNVKLSTGAVTPTAAALLGSLPSAAEKSKQWQRELLMERIRSRAAQHKTFPELSKAMRMSMLEKRYALDAVEKSNLQKCLDSMQHCIKVTSRQGLVERLESLSRQLGLKFMEDTSGLFISTDMFYLEIILDANGALADVKVHHECKIEQQSCSELVNCLNRGDFADFTVQLEGLSSIYQLNAEPKVKTKAFVALQAMETDLYNLFQMQNFSKDMQQLVKDSSIGYVLKRRGGHPMKLIYFVSSYDLISLETKSLQQLTTELITSKDIGFSVSVNLEASSANKLQILPVVSVSKDPQTGVDVPIYAQLTQMNSMLLPATFVLRLNKPLPVCHATLRALGVQVGAVTDVSGMDSQGQKEPTVSTIMNLVVQTASEQQLKNSQKGLFVCLPDQTHCYFFTENKQMQASLVSSVPFTEPMQVPKILDFLKKQALFYTLLASCVRPQTKMGNDMESTTILEVNAISFQQISVALQHTYDESMATVEFDLRDGSVRCTIYYLNHNYDMLSLKLTKIAEKCLSIPVTIRALIKYWDQESLKMFQRNVGGSSGMGGTTGAGNGFGNFSLAMGPNDPGGIGGGNNGNSTGGRTVKMEPNTRQQMQSVSAVISTGNTTPSTSGLGSNVAGFLKYKNDIKKEDFHDSPKSQSNTPTLQCVDASSLGPHQQQQLQLQEQQHSVKVSDIEIADKYKNIWKDKTPNLKNCVSITPISPDNNRAIQQNLEVKRTVGIEIIPLTAQGGNSVAGSVSGCANSGNVSATAPTVGTAQAPNSSSTITITPINSASVSGGATALKDKKLSGSAVGVPSNMVPGNTSKRTIDSVIGSVPLSEAQKEKKRKKKRDDSPMGPPEKVYSRQNSPAGACDASAAVVGRKFSSPSSSPKGGSGGLLVSSATSSALLSTRPSPKHSPVYSSPKHTNTASNSPKSPFGTHSPKHGSSGKPSMSTLKSAAATSLSPKGDKNISGNLPTSTSAVSAAAAAGVAAANAVKSAMGVGNMQQMKAINHHNLTASMSSAGVFAGSGNVGGPILSGGASGIDMNTAAMRKVAAGAVSLTGCTMPAAPAASPATAMSNDIQLMQQQQQQQQLQPQQSQQAIGNSEMVNSNRCGMSSQSLSSTEYMVKSSQEGLKLTINKTSTKSVSNSTSKTKGNNNNTTAMPNMSPIGSAGATVKKQHTGLKPGVNSGPASKKSAAFNSSNSLHLATTTTSPIKGATTKHLFQKSNSSGNLSVKLSNAGNTNFLSNAGGLTKSSSINSFADFSSNTLRKSNKKSGGVGAVATVAASSSSALSSSASQPATRMDHNMDMMKILQYASPAMAANMEGFMKGLNSKFQIPKLSQRGVSNTAASGTTTTAAITHSYSAPTTPTNLSPPISAPYACATSSVSGTTLSNSLPAVASASFGKQNFANDSHAIMQQQQHLKTNERTSSNAVMGRGNERSPPPPYHAAVAAAGAVPTKATMSPIHATNHNLAMASVALSSTPPPPPPPPPPPLSSTAAVPSSLQQSSVSVHIMKSPVPSPLLSVTGVGSNEMLHQHQHQHQHHYHQSHMQQQQPATSLDFLNNANVTSTNPIEGVSAVVAATLTGK